MATRIENFRAVPRALLTSVALGAISVIFSAPARAQETPPAAEGGTMALPTVEVEANKPGAGGAGAGDATGTGPGESGNRFTGYNAVNATAALKVDTPILQTPVAVQVVPRETMDDQQDITIQQALVGNVSSVYQASSPNVTSFNIRGFFDTRDEVFYNGLSLNNTVNLDTSNVQNFQVLKGPAAILYGRVEPGGIIYLETKLPQEIPYFSVQEQAGSFGQTRTTVDATGPLTDDKTWLYRLNLDFDRSDSFVDFLSSKNLFIAPAITYHPIEQFTLHINAFYQNSTIVDNTAGTVAFGDRPAPIPISRYLEDPGLTQSYPTQTHVELVNYDWTFNINPNWSVTNRFLYAYQEEFLSDSGPIAPTTLFANPLPLFDFFSSGPTLNVRSNLDLKGKFDTGPLQHSVLIGADYFTFNEPVIPSIFFFPTNTLNIFNPVYFPSQFSFQNPCVFTSVCVNPLTGASTSFVPFTKIFEEDKGVYAQDLISAFDDSVHFLLGAREDWGLRGSGTGIDVAPGIAADLAQAGPVSLPGFAGSQILDKALSPRIGLVYQPVPWLSFYGNYTKSFGLNNGISVSIPHESLPPEIGFQWEGGVKAESFDKRLSVAMAYYEIIKTNVAIMAPGASGAIFSQVIGAVESKGVEFDLTGRVNENWSLIANFSHDDVRTKKGSPFNPADPTDIIFENPIVGNRFPGVPENAGNLWLKYEALGDFKGLSVAGGLNVIGSMQGDLANSFVLPQYTLLSGMISYRFPWEGAKITAQLNVTNITDVTYYPTATSRVNVVVGAPRAIIGSLRVEF